MMQMVLFAIIVLTFVFLTYAANSGLFGLECKRLLRKFIGGLGSIFSWIFGAAVFIAIAILIFRSTIDSFKENVNTGYFIIATYTFVIVGPFLGQYFFASAKKQDEIINYLYIAMSIGLIGIFEFMHRGSFDFNDNLHSGPIIVGTICIGGFGQAWREARAKAKEAINEIAWRQSQSSEIIDRGLVYVSEAKTVPELHAAIAVFRRELIAMRQRFGNTEAIAERTADNIITKLELPTSGSITDERLKQAIRSLEQELRESRLFDRRSPA